MNGRNWVSADSIAPKASCVWFAKKMYSLLRTPSSAASKSVSWIHKITGGASSSWPRWCRMRNRSIEHNGARATRHKGLTLVELLVAISVLGFVAVLGWRGLDSIVRARIALTSDLEQTRGMQLAFAQLQSDCAHLVSPSALPNRIRQGGWADQMRAIALQLGKGELHPACLLQVAGERDARPHDAV